MISLFKSKLGDSEVPSHQFSDLKRIRCLLNLQIYSSFLPILGRFNFKRKNHIKSHLGFSQNQFPQTPQHYPPAFRKTFVDFFVRPFFQNVRVTSYSPHPSIAWMSIVPQKLQWPQWNARSSLVRNNDRELSCWMMYTFCFWALRLEDIYRIT